MAKENKLIGEENHGQKKKLEVRGKNKTKQKTKRRKERLMNLYNCRDRKLQLRSRKRPPRL